MHTTEVADDVHAVIGRLKARFDPRAVNLIGHSGGAGAGANVLSRHPEDAAAAVLITFCCDPQGFMDRWARPPDVPKALPNPSRAPIDTASRVPRQTLVWMVMGSKDNVVLTRQRPTPPPCSAAVSTRDSSSSPARGTSRSSAATRCTGPRRR